VIKTTGTAQYGDALLEQARRATPVNRLGTAEEVAHLITYLGVDGSGLRDGQTYYIDGGGQPLGRPVADPGLRSGPW